MEIYILGSGSSGNSTLIVTKEKKKILVDVGIGIRDLKNKLSTFNYTLDDIDVVLITHSHIDHMRCLKYFDPSIVYTPEDKDYFASCNIVEPYYEYDIASLKVLVLPTSHDTFSSVGYVINDDDYKLVYMTDTGYVNRKLFRYMANADCYIFESNHDETMLLNTNRPAFLKRRILSDVGHLSNSESARVLLKLIGKKTKTIVLAHLSEEANTPECALYTFFDVANSLDKDISMIKLIVAKRYEITSLREVEQLLWEGLC